jgi:cysteine dioxygenase
MNPDPLDFLLADLDRALAEEGRSAKVTRLLAEYAQSGADDWKRYAFFEANYYSRNLVRLSDVYELIVLCWGPGQRSPIHDHAAQRCWMGVLEGRVRETIYRVGESTPPTAGPAREFAAGGVAFIVDDMGWHRIEPVGDAPAVTLHLYSKPIRECRVLDEGSGTILHKRMSYHSVGGKVASGAR